MCEYVLRRLLVEQSLKSRNYTDQQAHEEGHNFLSNLR